MLLYRLPWPPTVNNLYPVNKGRKLLSHEGRLYADTAAMCLYAQGIPARPAQGPLTVTVELHAPDARRRDVDNYNKAILDALVRSHVVVDDNRKTIRRLEIEWGLDDPREGHVLVEIRPYIRHELPPLSPA